MRAYQLTIVAGALALGACATTDDPDRFCNAAPGQLFVGQKADAESGLAMLRATGARVIRWVPPRTAVTMEVQQGRLTVAYDDAMNVTSVACS